MQATLIACRDIAPDIRHFVFEVPELNQLSFLPGQFVSIREDINGAPVTRAYSIASAPCGNRLELCLNRVQDGRLSPYLFTLTPGDTIEMRGPLGNFVLRRHDANALFIATGTGIAPIRAILQARLAEPHPPRYRLLFGVRYEHSLLYREEFEALAARIPQFEFWPTLTRPEPSWQGRTGRVQEHLDAALEGRTDLDVYICGLRAMVDSVRQMLKDRGFPRAQIIYERYD